jgi:hypothetical protein
MKLEQQLCSLELAKRLKELEVKQDSYFWWTDYGMPHIITDKSIFWEKTQKQRCFSAFTVAELGEMLPMNVLPDNDKKTRGNGYWLECVKENGQWSVDYICWGDVDDTKRLYKTKSETEADARAKMLIYLLENKLISN